MTHDQEALLLTVARVLRAKVARDVQPDEFAVLDDIRALDEVTRKVIRPVKAIPCGDIPQADLRSLGDFDLWRDVFPRA